MLELVFVIVAIGILAITIIPRAQNDLLQEAAFQLVGHIRYTQHLAMVDDKFDPTDQFWYRTRWQIFFANGAGTNNRWSYTIFSDTAGMHTGNPDPIEVAVNPLNPSKRLTGGANGAAIIHTNDAAATREMNLGEKYDIQNINFSASCINGQSQRIAFDHLGRPMRGAFQNYNTPYPANGLITAMCVITLTDSSGGNAMVAIAPETGYACIWDGAQCIM